MPKIDLTPDQIRIKRALFSMPFGATCNFNYSEADFDKHTADNLEAFNKALLVIATRYNAMQTELDEHERMFFQLNKLFTLIRMKG